MALITGAWRDTQLVCGNHPHGVEPPVMELQMTAKTLSYVCPKCSILNCKDNEPVCKNRLSVYEYEKMLDHVASLIADADEADEVANLRNYRWKRKAVEFQILEHEDDKMKISVLNRTEIL